MIDSVGRKLVDFSKPEAVIPGRSSAGKGHNDSFMESNLDQSDEIRKLVPSVCEFYPKRKQCLC